MRRGRKRIRDVRVGDQVLSFDVRTAQLAEREVLHIHRHTPRPVGRLNVASGRTSSSTVSSLTRNHPVFDEKHGGLLRADELGKKSRVLCWDGQRLHSSAVEGAEFPEEHLEEVFNLTVGELHTYIADGVVVHNKSYPAPCEPNCAALGGSFATDDTGDLAPLPGQGGGGVDSSQGGAGGDPEFGGAAGFGGSD